MRMKALILIVSMSPLFLTGQMKTIIFNCEGFPTGITVENISVSLDTFLGISSDFSFKIIPKQSFSESNNYIHYTFQQYYKNYPVEDAIFKIHYKNNSIYYINGTYLTKISSDIENITIDEKAALNAALKYTNAQKYIWNDEGNVSIW
ncbi:MAG: hypothetical protein JWO06_3596, partial [Bacteroidota bacterium]|nr:hypothetical protein [Bacteroidota bacterium]